jgi:CheY-like chemotaxis protein
VLVVEDDEGTRELLKGQLEDLGLRVTLAGNGEEAEKAMERLRPDLILLDLIMPVMDGTVFLRRLRNDPAGIQIPVVICTGKELSPDERESLLSQAGQILSKGEGFETRLRAVLSDMFSLDPAPASSESQARVAEEAPGEV